MPLRLAPPSSRRRRLADNLPHMRRFEAKYTDVQRHAVIRAMVDEGWSAPKTICMAAAGELPGVDGAFEIPLGTVYWLARRERHRREAEAQAIRCATQPLEVQLEQIVQRLLNILLIETQRLLSQAERGETDFEQLRWLIRCDRELRKTVSVVTDYKGLSELDHLTGKLASAVSTR